MSKSAAENPGVNELPIIVCPPDEPTRLVCASLALAVAFVVLRIANLWP